MSIQEKYQSWKSMYRFLYGKAVFEYRQNGIRGIIRGYKRYRTIKKHMPIERQRIVLHGQTRYEQFDFVRLYNPTISSQFLPSDIDQDQPLTINWIIPDIKIGSGGHTTIFRMIALLEERGHVNRVYVYDSPVPLPYTSGNEVKRIVKKHFFDIKADFFLGADVSTMKDSDILVATSWHTAYAAYPVINTKKKCYFVQDFEPEFTAKNSEYVFAEMTYSMGYDTICAGPWLEKKMQSYGNRTTSFSLAYNAQNYRISNSSTRKDRQIAFYARFVTERRAFELGVMALEIVKEQYPDTNIVFFGWDCSNQSIPFDYENRGVIEKNELATLYNESTVGLVFSLTNYSLIPQEMMACGLPVVEIDGENTRSVYDKDGIISLALPNPYDVAEKIIALLENSDAAMQQANAAQQWVSQFSWENAADIVENFMYTNEK